MGNEPTNQNNITYKEASPDDIQEIQQLITKVFTNHVAPNYSDEGVKKFLTYIELPEIINRFNNKHFMLLAKAEDLIVGVIEMRNNDHISLLFVDTKHQGKGIARKLFDLAIKKCKKNYPSLKEVSVNSSPNAVSIYEKLGFKRIEEEQIKNGIRFTSMEFVLQS